MSKIQLSSTPEQKSIVAEEKSLDSRSIVVGQSRKTSEAQLRAIRKYEEKNKRINCRVPAELWEKIESTGESANSIIIKALELYFSEQ